jgi:DNA repair protein RadC
MSSEQHCASQTKRGLEKQVDKLQSALDCCNEDRRTAQREQEHTRELLEKELAEVAITNHMFSTSVYNAHNYAESIAQCALRHKHRCVCIRGAHPSESDVRRHTSCVVCCRVKRARCLA